MTSNLRNVLTFMSNRILNDMTLPTTQAPIGSSNPEVRNLERSALLAERIWAAIGNIMYLANASA